MPEFKLRMPIADSTSSSNIVEATLCSYVVRDSSDSSWSEGSSPARFFRLIYRAKNVGGGALPPASARPHDDEVIEGTSDAELEERRLMATEDSRQRYSLRFRG